MPALVVASGVPRGGGGARQCRPASARAVQMAAAGGSGRVVICRFRPDSHRGGGESNRRASIGGQADWWSSRQPALGRKLGRTVRAGTAAGEDGSSSGEGEGADSTPAVGGGAGEVEEPEIEVLPEIDLDQANWPTLAGRGIDPREVEKIMAKPEEERTYDDYKFMFGGPKPKFMIGKFPFGAGYSLFGLTNVLYETNELMVWCYESGVSGIFFAVLNLIKPIVQPLQKRYYDYKEGRKAGDAAKQAARIAFKIQYPKWWQRNFIYLKLEAWWQTTVQEEYPSTYARGVGLVEGYKDMQISSFEKLRKYQLWKRRWVREMGTEIKTVELLGGLLWRSAVIILFMSLLMGQRNSLLTMALGYPVCGLLTGAKDRLMYGPAEIQGTLHFVFLATVCSRFIFGIAGASFPPRLM